MSTAAEIERLNALVDRLLPLAARARGEVIAADDWNTVVQALLEVARATVSAGATTAVPDHEHLSQVTSAWLDPRLRTLTERGPLADPVATSRVSALERRAELSLQQFDQLSAQLRDVRVATSRQETNDIDRESTLTALTRKIDGIADPRDEITTLRNSLDSISTNVAAVSTFAAGLQDLTPAALIDGMKTVDELKTRLTTPSGELLDAAEFDRQLADIRGSVVTQEQLTAALRDVKPQLPDSVRDAILGDARAAAQQQAQTSAAAVAEGVRAQLSSRIDEAQQSVTQAAKDAAGQFRDDVQAQVTEQLRAVIDAGDTAVRNDAEQSVKAATDALKATVDQQVTDFASSLSDRVAHELDRVRPDLLAGLSASFDERFAELKSSYDDLASRIGDLRTSVTGTATALAALKQSTAAAMDQRDAALRAEIATKVASAAADNRAAQASAIDALRTQLTTDQDRLRTDLLTTLTKEVDTRINTRIQPNPIVVQPTQPIGPVRPVAPIDVIERAPTPIQPPPEPPG